MNEAANELGLEVLSIRPQGLLLYNAHLWNSLKAEGMVELNDAIQAGLQNPDVADFLALIEQKAISLMPRQPRTETSSCCARSHNLGHRSRQRRPSPPRPRRSRANQRLRSRAAQRKTKRVAKRGAKAVGISS